jgi:two-component system, chemotaxis family, CheB/CheR fusion protein
MPKKKTAPTRSSAKRISHATTPAKHRESQQKAKEDKAFPIVGMGASAGGLEAFEKFFAQVPPDIGMAFILVPHLDPGHASMMTELLRRVTKLEVSEIEDGVKVKPNHVYVIPPNKDMSIYHGTINLETPEKTRGLRMPIDSFFRSLAEDQRDLSIGVILSGTGTDGTLGIRAIHGAGGVIMVQEPGSAKYPGMPGSAAQTGLVDYILPPEKMPLQLAAYVKRSVRRAGKRAEFPVAMEDRLRKMLSLVRSRTGHDFSLYKKTTLNRRIEKRMNLHGIEDISDYVRYLQENPGETELLFKDFLIGVTQFFRDPEAFEELKKTLLKYLKGEPEGGTFRAWIPGCGTGEETYSVAITLMECLDELKRDFKVQLFGSDIDAEGINHARTGIYSNNIVEDVNPDRLRRFFVKEEGSYRVKREIREMIVFAVQDLTKDPPFTRLDLLSCRNLLIYLETELQDRLLPLFHYSLRPGGILYLGTSETIGKFADLFEVSDRKFKIYRAKKGLSTVRQEMWEALPWTPHAPAPAGEGEEVKKPKEIDIIPDAQRTLLETFVPPSAIVNEKGEILYIHGDTGKYLAPPRGRPNWSIFDMAREGMKFELRSGVHYVLTRMKERRYENLKVKTNHGYHPITLTVKPFAPAKESQGLVLVTFEDIVKEEKRPPGRKSRKPEGHLPKSDMEERLRDAEKELVNNRETLQATIEELQAANEEAKSTNEEMQSTNEELQSANEELETSREELQSMNEELTTLNSELQAKIDLVSRAEADMKILLDNTRIGVIFLDSNFCIQRFTSEATKVFNLIPGDTRRPIQDIRSNLKIDDIERNAREVLETLRSTEKEVQTKDGKWYLMRIIPYRTGENMIDGVVLTFTDVTEMKRSAEAINQLKNDYHAASEFAESIVETVRESLVVLDEELRVVSANRSFYKTFAVPKEETEGRLIYDLGNRQWDIPDLKKLLGEILLQKSEFSGFPVEHDFANIGRKRMILNARKVVKKEGPGKPMILLAIEDVTDKSGIDERR